MLERLEIEHQRGQAAARRLRTARWCCLLSGLAFVSLATYAYFFLRNQPPPLEETAIGPTTDPTVEIRSSQPVSPATTRAPMEPAPTVLSAGATVDQDRDAGAPAPDPAFAPAPRSVPALNPSLELELDLEPSQLPKSPRLEIPAPLEIPEPPPRTPYLSG